MLDHEKIRRETMRWYVLLCLYNAKPVGAPEEIVLSTMQGLYADATQREVRLCLDYLSDRGLVDLDKQPSGRWQGDLTRHGVDGVEYTVPMEPGIARPARFI